MKKILILLFSIACLSTQAYEGVFTDSQIAYLPSIKSWVSSSTTEDQIILTKKTSTGTGSYSEYYYNNGTLAISMSSNYEFIFDGQLISVDNAGLKYGKIVYRNEKFEEQPLTAKELEKIFPNAEIIKISEFNNGKITIKKQWFKKKTILLLNDTNEYYHKFSYQPKNVKDTQIKGLVTLKHPGVITFSHYKDKEGKLKIYVKN